MPLVCTLLRIDSRESFARDPYVLQVQGLSHANCAWVREYDAHRFTRICSAFGQSAQVVQLRGKLQKGFKRTNGDGWAQIGKRPVWPPPPVYRPWKKTRKIIKKQTTTHDSWPPPEQNCRKMSFPAENKHFLPEKVHFPSEKKMHFPADFLHCPAEKYGLRGALCRKPQEIAGGFQSSRIKNASQLSQEKRGSH